MCWGQDARQLLQQRSQVVRECKCASVCVVWMELWVKQRGKPWLSLAPWPISSATKHTHTQRLFCSQQRLPVLVWPQQRTKKKRRVKEGKDEADGKRAAEKCKALSAGSPSLCPSDICTFKHTPMESGGGGKAREAAQVTNDQMRVNAVNLEVDQRGLPPLRICLSKYPSSLPVSGALTHLLCRGLKKGSRAGAPGR